MRNEMSIDQAVTEVIEMAAAAKAQAGKRVPLKVTEVAERTGRDEAGMLELLLELRDIFEDDFSAEPVPHNSRRGALRVMWAGDYRDLILLTV
jgi:hypothetical protein